MRRDRLRERETEREKVGMHRCFSILYELVISLFQENITALVILRILPTSETNTLAYFAAAPATLTRR